MQPLAHSRNVLVLLLVCSGEVRFVCVVYNNRLPPGLGISDVGAKLLQLLLRKIVGTFYTED